MTESTCKKCSYTWNYKGKMMKRTCPNCSHTWIVKAVESIGDVNDEA